MAKKFFSGPQLDQAPDSDQLSCTVPDPDAILVPDESKYLSTLVPPLRRPALVPRQGWSFVYVHVQVLITSHSKNKKEFYKKEKKCK